ncbi:MAG: SnoaL-like domain-containing protein [Clostridiales bacterium]|nr:SnoaL-like domain-containing protein [Clostridiales bacterium]
MWIGKNVKPESFAKAFFDAVAAQDAAALIGFFTPDASVRWHCTNECFTAAQYVLANCEYPGDWASEVEHVHSLEEQDLIITVARVWLRQEGRSFHVTSFFHMEGAQITSLDEYWGDDGDAPKWRQDMNIGAPIK